MESKRYLRLKCRDCENVFCKDGAEYPLDDYDYGCIREINEEEYDKYYYYTAETLPFIYIDTVKEYQNRVYKEFLNLLDRIYTCPLIRTFR